MFKRIERSWELTKQSFAILSENKSLMLFPVMSALATIVVIASFAVPIFATGAYRHAGEQRSPLDYAVLFAFYFVCYFVQIFFNCALMAAANQAFCGGHAKVSDGLGMAMARLPQIVLFAAFAATVGMILRTLEERVGLIGKIVISLLGAAWSIMTYFMAPVIVFEGLSAFEGVGRSTALIKKTWGESLAKNLSFAAITFLGFIAGIAGAIVIGIAIGPLVAIASFFTYFLVLITAISTLDGIFKVALYRYASWGVVPPGYTPELIQGAFAVKEKKGWLT